MAVSLRMRSGNGTVGGKVKVLEGGALGELRGLDATLQLLLVGIGGNVHGVITADIAKHGIAGPAHNLASTVGGDGLGLTCLGKQHLEVLDTHFVDVPHLSDGGLDVQTLCSRP